MEAFTERFRVALSNAKMTQAELAKRSGLSTSRICRYYKGEYIPKQDSIYKIARALNVSPGWLLGFGDDPSPNALFVNVNLTFEEHQFMTEYRLLNEEGRRIVKEVLASVRKTKSLNDC